MLEQQRNHILHAPPSRKGSMNETIDKRTHRSTILSRVVAVIICVLLVLFLAASIGSRDQVNAELEEMKEGPYPVSVAAGHIETLLVSLKTLTAYPDVLFSDATAASLRKNFAEINQSALANLEVISAHPLDEAGDQVMNLRKQYRRLMTYQSLLLSMIMKADTSSAEVTDFVHSHIDPQIELLLKSDLEVLEASTQAVEDTYNSVTDTIHANMLISYIFMAAVVLAVAAYLIILNKKTRLEAKLREQLNTALVEAQAASEAKSAFLANMSHDLRTPMNAIIGLTSITRSHMDDPKRVEECLNRIIISSEHLLGLIDDVLDMSKIESGHIDLNEVDFSLPSMLTNLYMVVEPQRREKHQMMRMNIRNISNEDLYGDSMRLTQVLINLTGNAIKYTPEGGYVNVMIEEVPLATLYELRNAELLDGDNAVTVIGEIQAAPHFDENEYTALQITVSDNGIGMSKEFLSHIFDAFERERNETTNFTQGTGLGMAITKKIVDAMNGHIHIDSTVGQGSTFQVTLPIRVANEGGEEKLTARTNVVKSGHTVRILLTDDEKEARENALAEAERMGIELVAVASGTEALTAVHNASSQGRPFDGYIIDWVMTGMDGIETARRILDNDGVTECSLYLAAYDPTNIEEQARAIGVHNFVAKPLFTSRLQEIVAALRNESEEEVAPAESAEPAQLHGRVLLVEDNEINCEIATELISEFGPTVEVARDGLEAFERVQEAEPGYYGLIFMDWQMPRMNGIEATRAIVAYEKEQSIPHTPIVAMTANAFTEDREATAEAGMDGFMAKPINLGELKENLTKYFAD